MSTRPIDKPLNILWISLEDCSPRLGCYGDPVAQTPNLDAFAQQGRRYTKAYSTAPVCAPARCGIITGVYAASIGAQHMRVVHGTPPEFQRLPSYECVPPAYVKLLPEYLRGAGYFCANNDKTDYQFAPPFTAWNVQGKEAHWRQRSPDQPFFAVFNSTVTHESAMWDKDGPEPLTNPASVTVPPYFPDTLETRKAIARHYDNLARIDTWVGKILRELEEDGLAEDTVVFIWSDHGEGLPRHKRWLYEMGLRVPLMVRWPGVIPAGETSDRLVSTIDLAPTILRIAKIPTPVHFQGMDFLSAECEGRRHAFATRDRFDEFYDCQRSVHDRRFHYIRTYHPEIPEAQWNDYLNKHPVMREIWRTRRDGTLPEAGHFFFRHPRPPEELYDTKNDPWELTNLADRPEYLSQLETFRSVLDNWQTTIGDRYQEPEDQMIRRFWPDMKQPETKSPLLIGYDGENHGTVVENNVRLSSPAIIQLHSPTQGGSIGYRFADDPENRWRLYTGPLRLDPGEYEIQAKTIRIGYAESPESCFQIKVSPRIGG